MGGAGELSGDVTEEMAGLAEGKGTSGIGFMQPSGASGTVAAAAGTAAPAITADDFDDDDFGDFDAPPTPPTASRAGVGDASEECELAGVASEGPEAEEAAFSDVASAAADTAPTVGTRAVEGGVDDWGAFGEMQDSGAGTAGLVQEVEGERGVRGVEAPGGEGADERIGERAAVGAAGPRERSGAAAQEIDFGDFGAFGEPSRESAATVTAVTAAVPDDDFGAFDEAPMEAAPIHADELTFAAGDVTDDFCAFGEQSADPVVVPAGAGSQTNELVASDEIPGMAAADKEFEPPREAAAGPVPQPAGMDIAGDDFGVFDDVPGNAATEELVREPTETGQPCELGVSSEAPRETDLATGITGAPADVPEEAFSAFDEPPGEAIAAPAEELAGTTVGEDSSFGAFDEPCVGVAAGPVAEPTHTAAVDDNLGEMCDAPREAAAMTVADTISSMGVSDADFGTFDGAPGEAAAGPVAKSAGSSGESDDDFGAFDEAPKRTGPVEESAGVDAVDADFGAFDEAPTEVTAKPMVEPASAVADDDDFGTFDNAPDKPAAHASDVQGEDWGAFEETSAAPAAPAPAAVSGSEGAEGEDDDDWGDFGETSAAAPTPPPQASLQAAEDGDDWGDFDSQDSQPPPHPPPTPPTPPTPQQAAPTEQDLMALSAEAFRATAEKLMAKAFGVTTAAEAPDVANEGASWSSILSGVVTDEKLLKYVLEDFVQPPASEKLRNTYQGSKQQQELQALLMPGVPFEPDEGKRKSSPGSRTSSLGSSVASPASQQIPDDVADYFATIASAQQQHAQQGIARGNSGDGLTDLENFFSSGPASSGQTSSADTPLRRNNSSTDAFPDLDDFFAPSSGPTSSGDMERKDSLGMDLSVLYEDSSVSAAGTGGGGLFDNMQLSEAAPASTGVDTDGMFAGMEVAKSTDEAGGGGDAGFGASSDSGGPKQPAQVSTLDVPPLLVPQELDEDPFADMPVIVAPAQAPAPPAASATEQDDSFGDFDDAGGDKASEPKMDTEPFGSVAPGELPARELAVVEDDDIGTFGEPMPEPPAEGEENHATIQMDDATSTPEVANNAEDDFGDFDSVEGTAAPQVAEPPLLAPQEVDPDPFASMAPVAPAPVAAAPAPAADDDFGDFDSAEGTAAPQVAEPPLLAPQEVDPDPFASMAPVAPAPVAAAPAPAADDDFGDFDSAEATAAPSAPLSKPAAPAASTELLKHESQEVHGDPFASMAPITAPVTTPPAAVAVDDDFGDFDSAGPNEVATQAQAFGAVLAAAAQQPLSLAPQQVDPDPFASMAPISAPLAPTATPVLAAPADGDDDFGDFDSAGAPMPPRGSGAGEPSWGSLVFAKGDLCLYRTRDGRAAMAKVIFVDQTLDPPAYSIEVEGVTRDTEGSRLAPIPGQGAGAPPESFTPRPSPAATANQHDGLFAGMKLGPVSPLQPQAPPAAPADDDFGSFEGETGAPQPTAQPYPSQPVHSGGQGFSSPGSYTAGTPPLQAYAGTGMQPGPLAQVPHPAGASTGPPVPPGQGMLGVSGAPQAMPPQELPPLLQPQQMDDDPFSDLPPIQTPMGGAPAAAAVPAAPLDEEDEFGDFDAAALEPEPAAVTPEPKAVDERQVEQAFGALDVLGAFGAKATPKRKLSADGKVPMMGASGLAAPMQTHANPPLQPNGGMAPPQLAPHQAHMLQQQQMLQQQHMLQQQQMWMMQQQRMAQAGGVMPGVTPQQWQQWQHMQQAQYQAAMQAQAAQYGAGARAAQQPPASDDFSDFQTA